MCSSPQTGGVLNGSLNATSDTESSRDLPIDKEKQQPSLRPDGDHIVDWDGDNDPLNPRSMSVLRKWLILIVVADGSLLV